MAMTWVEGFTNTATLSHRLARIPQGQPWYPLAWHLLVPPRKLKKCTIAGCRRWRSGGRFQVQKVRFSGGGGVPKMGMHTVGSTPSFGVVGFRNAARFRFAVLATGKGHWIIHYRPTPYT